jgi:hypothetical protein
MCHMRRRIHVVLSILAQLQLFVINTCPAIWAKPLALLIARRPLSYYLLPPAEWFLWANISIMVQGLPYISMRTMGSI